MARHRKFSQFEKDWMRIYAKDIPKKAIDRYVVDCGNYIWHVFSWKLLPENSFLKGDAARAAFDRQSKTGVRVFEPFEDDPLPAGFQPEQLTAAFLDERVETYVMAENGGWSYIKTHEGDLCGPYFIRRR